MVCTRTVVICLWCLLTTHLASAAEPPQILAAGDWSKPVADTRGYAVRGRLVLCEHPRDDASREVVTCIELQEASDFVGEDMQVYCEIARRDFRPEHKLGLRCELRDPDGKVVPTQPFPFGGGVPHSRWATLSKDTTIRLRTTPFGIRSEDGITICPDLGSRWLVARDDRREYHLSGTFTADPAKENMPPEKGHVWRGTIELPALTIRYQDKPAAGANAK